MHQNTYGDSQLTGGFTDQGDSVITSKFSGKLSEKLFKIGDIIDPGEVIALIENGNLTQGHAKVLVEFLDLSCVFLNSSLNPET